MRNDTAENWKEEEQEWHVVAMHASQENGWINKDAFQKMSGRMRVEVASSTEIALRAQ